MGRSDKTSKAAAGKGSEVLEIDFDSLLFEENSKKLQEGEFTATQASKKTGKSFSAVRRQIIKKVDAKEIEYMGMRICPITGFIAKAYRRKDETEDA